MDNNMKIKTYIGILSTFMIFGIFLVNSHAPIRESTFLKKSEPIFDFSKVKDLVLDKFLKFETSNSNIVSDHGSTSQIPVDSLKAMYNVFDLHTKIKHLDM